MEISLTHKYAFCSELAEILITGGSESTFYSVKVYTALNVKTTNGSKTQNTLIFDASLRSDAGGTVAVFGIDEVVRTYQTEAVFDFMENIKGYSTPSETQTIAGGGVIDITIQILNETGVIELTQNVTVFPSSAMYANMSDFYSNGNPLRALTLYPNARRMTATNAREYLTFLYKGDAAPTVLLSVAFANANYAFSQTLPTTAIYTSTDADTPSLYSTTWVWATVEKFAANATQWDAQSFTAFAYVKDAEGNTLFAVTYDAKQGVAGQMFFYNAMGMPDTLLLSQKTWKPKADFTQVVANGRKRNVTVSDTTELEALTLPLAGLRYKGAASDFALALCTGEVISTGRIVPTVTKDATYEPTSSLNDMAQMKITYQYTVDGLSMLTDGKQSGGVFDSSFDETYN